MCQLLYDKEPMKFLKLAHLMLLNRISNEILGYIHSCLTMNSNTKYLYEVIAKNKP